MTLLVKRPGVWAGVASVTLMVSNRGLVNLSTNCVGFMGMRREDEDDVGWSGLMAMLGM